MTLRPLLAAARKAVAVCVVAIAMVAAGLLTAVPAHADDTLTVDTTTVAARYQYHFLNAVAQLAAGRRDTARVMLARCRDIMPDAAETYFYLAKCYSPESDDSMRVAMIEKAAALQPDNVTYKEALLPIRLDNNDVTAAASLAEDIVRASPDRTDMLQLLLSIYQYQKDNERSLQTLDRIAVQEGDNERITMTKLQIYNAMGDERRARKALDALVANHPLDLDYRIMRGNWYLGLGKKREALADYRAVLKEEPENENAMLSIMDYYRAEGLDSLADNERERLLISPKTSQETKIFLLKTYIRASEQATTDSTQVLQLFRRILQQPQPDTSIKEILLAYMQQKNMPRDTMKTVLVSILDDSPENVQARTTLILMANENKDYAEMIRLAKPALQYNPDEWAFSYLLATAYYMDGQEKECINVLEKAADNVDEDKDKQLAVQIYGLLGDALHTVGRNADSYKAYDNCLRIDGTQNPVLNNYAYYLSEDGGDLDRAASMSLKTIKAEPNNSTYLDTYAWVLYLQGRYEEARIYIDMAVKNLNPDEDNTTITDHQKSIYLKLGEPLPGKTEGKE